jgi:hypothetical protein
MKQPLSPAAAAAWEAFNETAERIGVFEDYGDALAAALRAVADQLKAPVDLGLYGNSYWAGMSAAETKLRAIAAELEP